jgi:predicted anti-sigma-YlaC factor YlaD
MRLRAVTCRDVVELVTEYLEGALSTTLNAEVEEHLRGCGGCAAHLDQMLVTIELLGQLDEAISPG